MDEILYLEADEEITGVIDKLKKTSAHSVGLVIPRNSTLIHSIVNLKLLKKEAEKHDREIALITGDRIGKNIASQVGLPVFEDIHSKKPVTTHAMPAFPKGDEVIEVDMSKDTTPSTEASDLKINHYGSDPDTPKITHNEINFDKPSSETKKMPEKKVEKVEPEKYISQSEHAVHMEREEKTGTNSRKGMFIAVGLFLAIILATILGLPQTSIVVTVAAEAFEKTIPITVQKDADKNNTQVVAGKLLELTKSEAKRVVATGKKDVGGKAKGSVTFSNAWDSNPIRFTSGTTLTASDGKVFTLTDAVTVPGATASLSQGQLVATPGTATGTITASEPGEAYNIKPTRFTIAGVPSERQSKIYAESSKDFSGGFTKQVNVMTQADIDGGKDELVAVLKKEALDELRKEAKNQKVLDEAVTQEIESVETNPQAVDTETDYFDLKVKVKYQVMAFDEKAVNQAVDQAIQKEVPQDKELLLGEGDEFVIGVSSTDYANEKLLLEGRVKTKVGTRVDSKAVKKEITGKNEPAIREELSTIPNVREINIYPFPSWWWQDTSFVPWNTRVKIVYE